MRGLPLSLRLVLIVTGAIFLLQIAAFAVQVTRDDGFTLGGIRPSFARQVVSLVRLFDRLPPLRRSLALDLLNNARFDVAVADSPPAPDPGGLLLGWSARITADRIAAEGLDRDRRAAGEAAVSLRSAPLPNEEHAHSELVIAGLVPAIPIRRAQPLQSGCPAQGRA